MGKGDAATCVPVLSAKCSAKCPCRAILEGSERFVYLVPGNPKFRQNTNCCLITLQTPFAILIHAFAVDVVARLCRPLAGARGESRVARSLSERPTAESGGRDGRDAEKEKVTGLGSGSTQGYTVS